MNALIRCLCLGLCLLVSVPALAASAEDAAKPTASTSKPTSKKSGKDAKPKDSTASKKAKGKARERAGSKAATAGVAGAAGAAATMAAAKGDQSGGFRSLSWGAPLAALAEPELREEAGELKYYVVPGDDPDVLGVPMREIVYVFCKGRLAGVLTRYDGQINHLLLLGKLKDAHGAPLESQPNMQGDRSWRFDAGGTSVMMEYSEKAFTGAAAWMAREGLAGCQ